MAHNEKGFVQVGFMVRQPNLALMINRITNDEPLTVCPTCTKRIVGGSANF